MPELEAVEERTWDIEELTDEEYKAILGAFSVAKGEHQLDETGKELYEQLREAWEEHNDE